MSLILDALKKLEKDRNTRRKKPVRIASDILLTGEPATRRRTLFLMAGLAGVAVAALVLTLLIVNPFSARTSVPERLTASSAPDQTAASEAAPGAAAVKKRTRTVPVKDTRQEEEEPGPVEAPKRKTMPLLSPEKTRVHEMIQPPTLTVSGIVWVEDRSIRKAMVNGEIVGEGVKIGKTTVVEIHPDHVLFSHEGQQFSVHLK
jgi:general secretion pathway protein B